MTEEIIPALGGGEPDGRPARLRRRRRWPWIVGAAGLVVVVGGAVVVAPPLDWVALTSVPSASATAPHPNTARVERRAVKAQKRVSGTLGYAGDYQILGQLVGTITAAPKVGGVFREGDVLYRVDATPVILLKGTTPAWRELGKWGQTGADVQQLNAALVALGYAKGLNLAAKSSKVTWATRQAIKKLQDAHGLDDTGKLELGRVVFLPGPVRVTTVPVKVGSPAGPAQPALTATSTRPQVTAKIVVTLAPDVAAGDAVSVWMPDLSTVKGTVRSVGTVATEADSGTATVPVLVDLKDAAAAVGLDKAPVMIGITTDTVDDALVVPVTALLAIAGGKYAVEIVEGVDTRLIEVQLGLVDETDGVVAVTGTGLMEGQSVVVPGS
jgi:hypothetical protein